MRITLQFLENNDACSEERELFAETFPKGAKVTLANLAKARKARLSIDWLYDHIPAERKPAFSEIKDKAFEEYWKIDNKAFNEYLEIRDKAFKEYCEIENKAFEECLEISNKTYKEYLEICDKALEEYWEIRDNALVEAFK